MTSNYFQDKKLDCNFENESFIAYLSDLKKLIENAIQLETSGDLDQAKSLIMDSYGQFSPQVYDLQKEAGEVFSGQFAEETKEIVLRYREIFETLSEEDINFLTGDNIEVTQNRIKLFLTQEIRDIDSILSSK